MTRIVDMYEASSNIALDTDRRKKMTKLADDRNDSIIKSKPAEALDSPFVAFKNDATKNESSVKN